MQDGVDCATQELVPRHQRADGVENLLAIRLQPSRRVWFGPHIAVLYGVALSDVGLLDAAPLQVHRMGLREAVRQRDGHQRPVPELALGVKVMLVSTLGQQLFVPLAQRAEPSLRTASGVLVEPAGVATDVFRCTGPQGGDATGQYTEEGMEVLKGSRSRAEAVASMIPTSAGKHRQRLIAAGDLVLDNGAYRFQRDVLFRSPSGASDVVLGRSRAHPS